MKKAFLLPLLAAAVLLGTLGLLAAPAEKPEDFKTVAVVSVASYDEVRGDVELLGRLTDNPDLAVGLEAMLKLVTKSRGLAGLDKARPLGLVVKTDGRTPAGYAMVPVTDLKKLLAVVRPIVGDPEDAGNGLLKIKTDKKHLYVKETKGWALVSEKPWMLAAAPADPTTVLPEMGKRYDLAVKLFASEVPERFRRKFVSDLKEGTKKDLARRPGESDREWAARKEISRQVLDLILGVVDDLDQITVGASLDHQTEKVFVEVDVTAREGSDTARQLARLKDSKSNFGGFLLPEAALRGNWTGKLPEKKIAILNTVLEAIRKQALSDIEAKGKPEAEARVARQLVEDAADLLRKTVAAGRVDGGAAVVLKPQAVTLLAGGYVADGEKLDKLAKQIAGIARAENPAVADWLTLDADRCNQVRLHTVSIPIPEDDENRERTVGLIGETLDVVLGIGRESVYIGAGRDAMKTLKRAIENSAAEAAKTVPPVQISLSVGPLAKFVSVVGEEKDRPQAALVAELLANQSGGDRLNLVASSIPNGLKYRLEAESGLLRLLGRLAIQADTETAD